MILPRPRLHWPPTAGPSPAAVLQAHQRVIEAELLHRRRTRLEGFEETGFLRLAVASGSQHLAQGPTRHERHAVDVGHDPVPCRHGDASDPHREPDGTQRLAQAGRAGEATVAENTESVRLEGSGCRAPPPSRIKPAKPAASATVDTPRPNMRPGRQPGRQRRRGRSPAVPWSRPRARRGCPPACSRRGTPVRPPQHRTRQDGACGAAPRRLTPPMVAEPQPPPLGRNVPESMLASLTMCSSTSFRWGGCPGFRAQAAGGSPVSPLPGRARRTC